MAPPRLDVFLEGLAAFQAGAAGLQAGEPLCLQPQEGRLACARQCGAVVGLVPADKRGTLSRGPWAGTVRSVKRQQQQVQVPQAAVDAAAEAAAVGGSGDKDGVAAAVGAAGGGGGDDGAAEQQPAAEVAAAEPAAEQQTEGAPSPPPPLQQQQQQQQTVVVQVLVRFTPEEQRWQQQRQQQEQQQQAEEEEEGAARLTTAQLEALAGDEEVRCMLRDERLQKVIAEIDAAPNRERALVQALRAPNFKEFADKVLAAAVPEPTRI